LLVPVLERFMHRMESSRYPYELSDSRIYVLPSASFTKRIV
jgi:hypothetical protein